MPRTIGITVVGLAMVLAACGARSSEAKSASPSAPDVTPSGEPSADPDGTSACVDPVGDVAESVDLSNVTLRRSGDQLIATFTATHALPEKGTALWSVTANGRHFDPLIQLAAKAVDGKQAALYDLSESDLKKEDLPGTIALQGTTMTAQFPMRLLAGLSAGATWHAVLSMNGSEADVCPNGAGIKFPAAWLEAH